MPRLLTTATAAAVACLAAAVPCPGTVTVLGFHAPACDGGGNLLPPPAFGSVQAAVDASVAYYAASPLDLPDSHNFPPYVWATFTDGLYIPTSFDIIAGFQNGLAVLGYAKLARRAAAGRGGNVTEALRAATFNAEYLLSWTLTKPTGAWPNVSRSTGLNIEWPLTTASQGDIAFGIDCIETDRVGIVGYALLKLHELTGEPRYLAAALHNARVLVANQQPGNATHAPWPFRVDSVTGAHVNGNKNGEMAFPLRLLLSLAAAPYGYSEFAAPAAALWSWVSTVMLPATPLCANATLCHWINLYEDRTQTEPITNRNSWTAMEMGRLLVEYREALDADWRAHADDILAYALAYFAKPSGVGNATLLGEQDNDTKPWGGTCSKIAGVAALYACAGGPAWVGSLARGNAYHMAYYSAPDDGARSAEAYAVGSTPTKGGWTEDAWSDVLHNLVDYMEAGEDGQCPQPGAWERIV